MRSQTLITVGIATFSLGLVAASIGNRLTAPSAEVGIGSGPAPTDTRQEPVTIPQIVSSVPGIEVVGVEMTDRDTSSKLVVDLRNNNEQAVSVLYLEAGTCPNCFGVWTGDASGIKAPVIPAHETVHYPVPTRRPAPFEVLRVAAVKYADGTVAGEEKATETILRKH